MGQPALGGVECCALHEHHDSSCLWAQGLAAEAAAAAVYAGSWSCSFKQLLLSGSPTGCHGARL
jgi:hypothetical protein